MTETRGGEIRHFDHPGAGRKRAKATPKGRTVDPEALAEIQALLGDRPRRRDLLIEHLHLVQDRYGQLSAAHLAALADEMALAFAEVYETATFYAHFDVVKEDEPALAPLVVRVCDSITCELFGATKLLEQLQGLADSGKLAPGGRARVVRAPCLGLCDQAPAVEVGHHFLHRADAPAVVAAIARDDSHPHIPGYIDYGAYVAGGGYQLLERVRTGALSVDTILTKLEQAGLRGLGGAGFPTARKWKSVRGEPGPRLMAVNGDEGEPGTFKDRHYLNTDPHRFLEGALIGAAVVEASELYIYLRDEYPVARAILAREIAKLPAGGPAIHLRRGAGAYICGEESSMLESIEGKRGLPRNRPPFPFQVGLFGRPTLINNVETLYWVRHILETGQPALRSYSVSGRVKDPGVKIVTPGMTVRQLIDGHCGGMQDGHRFKAYLPGGASGGILPASMDDLPLEFGQLEKHGCFVGSHAVVILSDRDDMKAVALNLMRFFEDESCGQCTPCRAGTEKAVKLMERPRWDDALLQELSTVMRDASICGLGPAAANPMLSVLKYFRDEVLS
jgi:NADH:ubiquinone oxidoreductase subunit F (NADH-binding)/NADH:ubiquinone oxidoreductase subunit E